MPSNQAKQQIPQIPTSIQFQGFAPDSDPITPGAMLDCQNLYATAKGYRSYPSLTLLSGNTLNGPCLGAFAGWLGNQFVVAAGTATTLYLFDLNTRLWVDQGLAIGGGVTRWRFDIYGNLLIAVNGVNPPFAYNGALTFTPLGGNPPVASLVAATDYDLFLFPPDSTEYWFSLSATIWVPSIATQTVHGNFVSPHGNTKAAHRIRDGIAIYANDVIIVGQFDQPPHFWIFRTVSHEYAGVLCHEAVANLGNIHYFPGNDDFYYFDGYSLGRIPNNLKEWFFDNLDGDHNDKIIARWDARKNLIFWHFPSVDANPPGTLDMWIALNIRNGKWTAHTEVENIEWPFFHSIPFSRLTYSVFQSQYATYADIPNMTYGDLLAAHATEVPAVVGADHGAWTYNGVPTESSFHTHMVGDRLNMFEVQRLRPQFSIYPTGGSLLHVHKQYVPGRDDGGPLTTLANLSSDGWFNCRSTARLQQFHLTFNGDFEIVALELDANYGGVR